ncbi:MAG TPA: hypothetical protein VEV81_16220 [Pyrinomonadaceae bacterium]|nr:hypothetical protein [Pyrinomonadaceae bacterium]
MKNNKDAFKVVGIILLCLFVFSVGVPLVLAAAGLTLGIFLSLAIGIIKLAVVLAVIYLVLVGIRAMLR